MTTAGKSYRGRVYTRETWADKEARYTVAGPPPQHRPALGACLLWTNAIRPDGYGRVTLAGRTMPPHRAAYEWHVGPIPEGLHLDHLCRVPHCVRVQHLEPVTQAENNRRAAEHRPLLTHCKHGHELTGDNVRIVTKPRYQRLCVTCRRAIGRAYYYRSAAAACEVAS